MLTMRADSTISIHALREEGDNVAIYRRSKVFNFYPRPPRGGRQPLIRLYNPEDKFLSTPSARRATAAVTLARSAYIFLSTPSARRATFGACVDVYPSVVFLSTPSARRATCGRGSASRWRNYFYPRPPRGGRRRVRRLTHPASSFLSTPSARRATLRTPPPQHPRTHFYPRPPRGGRHAYVLWQRSDIGFLSTPSARRATLTSLPSTTPPGPISIHALREEGDVLCSDCR